MRITFPELITPKTTEGSLRIPSERALRWIALGAVVLLAAYLRFANFEAIGYANTYYTAAVKSMLQSWHNFFFVAAEPGGSVSVDKPPVGFWLQAISAYFLGVNGFAVVLPQIIAGLLSVVVVYHLVRRSFGTLAGLLAALTLAITPVVVATDRNNTIDSTLILTLLLAAWAFIKATESGKLRFLLLGAALVGIGFNIKMLEAYLPLPAFYVLYLLGSGETPWRKVGKLALASIVLLVISLSWAVAVDLTPADQRPYVGSSGTNSEMGLIIGYNGVDRLLGMFGRRSGTSPGGNPFGGRNGGSPNRGFSGAAPGQNDGFTQRGPSNGATQSASSLGISETGQSGPLRLFIPPLSKEASWLLPFGILSALLLAFGEKPRWPIGPEHRALILWGGWLVTAGIFFSVAGFFHEYYLSTIAPPVAALAGTGFAELWEMAQKRPWPASLTLAAGAACTLWVQRQTALAFLDRIPWQPLVVALFTLGLAGMLVSGVLRRRWAIVPAWTCLAAALLVTPGAWSYLTIRYPSENQSLPAAYAGVNSGPANQGGLQVNQALLDYLQANTQQTEYLMAVPSSMQGSDYVLATGRPVLYLGGFLGTDQVKTPDELSQMVRQGTLRYIYWNSNGSGFRGGGFGNRGQSGISGWIESSCTKVPGFDTTTRNMGAPGGTTTRQANASMPSLGSFQISLYDCASH